MRVGAGAGRGVTLRTHDFECVGKAGKEGGAYKAEAAAAAAADVPVAPKLDLLRMRAKAGAEGGSVTERTMNRVFQVISPTSATQLRRPLLIDPLPPASGVITRCATKPEGKRCQTVRARHRGHVNAAVS